MKGPSARRPNRRQTHLAIAVAASLLVVTTSGCGLAMQTRDQVLIPTTTVPTNVAISTPGSKSQPPVTAIVNADPNLPTVPAGPAADVPAVPLTPEEISSLSDVCAAMYTVRRATVPLTSIAEDAPPAELAGILEDTARAIDGLAVEAAGHDLPVDLIRQAGVDAHAFAKAVGGQPDAAAAHAYFKEQASEALGGLGTLPDTLKSLCPTTVP